MEKQVQDLEHALDDLQNIKLGSADANETLKLKRLFLTFKTKYQQALKELAKREQSQGPTQISRMLEEAREENRALVEQQKTLKSMIQAFQKERPVQPVTSQDFQKFQQALHEKDRQIADLKHYELGFKRLSDDNWKLEQALNSQGKGERQQLLQELNELRPHVERLSQENSEKKQRLDSLLNQSHRTEQDLKERVQENHRLKEELGRMKETMVRGLREARELKQYYQNLIDEKTTVLQKNTRIQKHVEELREELKRREHALENAQTETAAAKAEKQEMERLLEGEKAERKEREDNLNLLSEQIQLIRGKLIKAEAMVEEKEVKAIEAQQHLAKKVRESSQLSETVEEKHTQIIRLQEEMLQSKVKVSEAHASLESEQERARRAHEQMEGLEEKYFRTYERLQEAEAEVRELKKVEEKHQQMQQLLNNLGNVMGQPVGMVPDAIRPPVKPVDAPPPKKRSVPKSKPKQAPDTLFDIKETPSKYKNDLFE